MDERRAESHARETECDVIGRRLIDIDTEAEQRKPGTKAAPWTAVIAGLVHFFVDLACIFLATAFIVPIVGSRVDWLWYVMLYNMFAFAFQLPVGAVSDRLRSSWKLASAGCGMIAAAFLIEWIGVGAIRMSDLSGGLDIGLLSGTGSNLWTEMSFSGDSPVSPAFASAIAVVAGLGNACFHVGCGIAVLKKSPGKAALPGIFVAMGAFGVYLAPILAARPIARSLGNLVGVLLMAACAAVLWVTANRVIESSCPEKSMTGTSYVIEGNYPEKRGTVSSQMTEGSSCRGLGKSALYYDPVNGSKIAVLTLIAVGGLLFTVCLRSYAGTIMGFSWKGVPLLGLLFTIGVVLGKMLGGVIGDRAGWIRTALSSLVVSAVLFFAAPAYPVCGLIGVFLFNITMPITLTALADLMPKYPGTAFGLTTMMLFLGTIPSMLRAAGIWNGGTIENLPGVVILSILGIAVGLFAWNAVMRRRKGSVTGVCNLEDGDRA